MRMITQLRAPLKTAFLVHSSITNRQIVIATQMNKIKAVLMRKFSVRYFLFAILSLLSSSRRYNLKIYFTAENTTKTKKSQIPAITHSAPFFRIKY
jgi:hypothetical protein